MRKPLNEHQLEILKCYKSNGLKYTCELYNLKDYQVAYLRAKQKLIDKEGKEDKFVRVVIKDENRTKTTVSILINHVAVEGELATIKTLLGI